MIYAGLLAAHRRFPRWKWLGMRKGWLRGHLWLGTLSALLIACHSGFSWGGPLEIALWVVLLLVIASGIFGLILQQFLPRLMTARVGCEGPYEQIPHLCTRMREEADEIVDAVCGAFDPAPGMSLTNTVAVMQYMSNAKAQLRDFYEQDVRPFLSPEPPKNSPILNALQAEARFSKLRRLPGLADAEADVDKLAKLCEERRLLLEQERLHYWLHSWLMVHIPLSIALLVLGAVHIFTALYY